MPQSKVKLGEILVSNRLITQEQLAEAVQQKARTGKLLGETLVELGYLNEISLTVALAKQLGVPYASRENKVLRKGWYPGMEQKITEEFSRKNLAIPLYMEGKILAVAMADPADLLLLDNLRMMTGCDIQPMIATRSDILRAIDEFFGKVVEEQRSDESASVADAGTKVVDFVTQMLNQAVAERASDIHLDAYGQRVTMRYRIDGVLFDRPAPPMELYVAVINRVKILAKIDVAERRLPHDGAVTMKLATRVIDFRVATCPSIYGENAVLRILDKKSVSLDIDKLGLEERQKKDFLAAVSRPHGLIFLTGPTGSGKTTTIYTLLNEIRSPEIKIMTAEDPVEYRLDGMSQLQVQPSIGLTFANAMRTFLRHDPDVIMLGEVRDSETAEACLRAAMTGHLVLSTLHTNTALEAIPRLINLGIEPFMLSSTICLVATQRLVRVLCAACRSPYKPDAALLQTVAQGSMLGPAVNPASATFYRSVGCAQCSRTGFAGRAAIYEVFLVNEEMAQIIFKAEGDIFKLREAAQKAGMLNLRASGWRKVLAGVTSVEEVLSATIA